MIPLEEALLKLKDLKQAIAFEKQRRYVDLQGRKQRFSQFALESLASLEPFAIHVKDYTTLLLLMRRYGMTDLGERIQILDKICQVLDELPLEDSGSRGPKTVMRTRIEKPLNEIDVKYVRGVGPKVASILNKAGVFTVEDLLYYFPRKHLDYAQRRKIRELQEGEDATVFGNVHSVSLYNTKQKNLWVVTLNIQDDTSVMLAKWIFAKAGRNMVESFKGRFTKGTEVMMSGKVKWDRYTNRLMMDRPEVEILSYGMDAPEEAAQSLHMGRIVPVYPLTEGLNLKSLRRAMRHALDDYLEGICDPMPAEIRKQNNLVDLQTALEHMHFPNTTEDYEKARYRLVFDELFLIQLRLAQIRSQYKFTKHGLCLTIPDDGVTRRFIGQLPFELTGAQKRVYQEILTDLQAAEPMYRLLQGDVGSGKTILALLTMLVAVDNGYQAVLMAPTEILAEQHYRNFIQWLTPLGLKTSLLVGKLKTKERREVLQGLLNGQIHVAVGTHALIQDDIEFARLGVVIVDEQHRFGVRQRIRLKSKADNPEMLSMTATPIPRTLAMTLHGDLDVSILDEQPPGRTPIISHLARGKRDRHDAYRLVETEIAKGRQAYIVFPLIEESETISAKAATAEFERLTKEVFPQLRVGLLHGKLANEEKDAVMQDFVHGRLDVLVSTTVIEVGVDVPNATVMLIESADRFGLAQLHQLRGRVGRGRHQSYCILLTDSKTDETLSRLRILVDSSDGFEIAERDLEIRGPGDFLGTRQSGLPDLVLTNLIQDKGILEQARQVAFDLVQNDPQLTQYPELHDLIYNKTEQLFTVLGSG